MGTRATLGGLPLLDAGEVSWALSAGVQPVVRSFAVMPDQLPIFLAHANSLTDLDLVIRSAAGGVTISGLRVLREEPGDNPHMKRIVVADRRAFWPHYHVLRRFNMRRKVGTTRRSEDWNGLVPVPVVPTFHYAAFSLRDHVEPWKANEVLKEVFEAIGESSVVIGGSLEVMPVENLVLDDRGDGAVTRTLALLPGAQVTMDANGVCRVFNSLTGAEQGLVGVGEIGSMGAMGPEVIGGGHVELCTEHSLRPRSVMVGFTIEAEVRFDFIALPSLQNDTDDFIRNPPRIGVNVIQVPDSQGITTDTAHYSQGSYCEFEAYLAAISDGRGQLNNVSEEIVRTAMVPGMTLAGALQVLGDADLDDEASDWAARIQAIERDYRTLYQIERHWVDRFLSLQASLVGTIDLVTGQRSPALAWGDYCIVWTQKGLLIAAKDGIKTSWFSNVTGYPGDGAEIGFPDRPDQANVVHQPAPCRVVVEDSEQGIVRLNYTPPPFGQIAMILPSRVELGPFRAYGPDDTEPIAFNCAATNGGVAQLSEEQKVCVILTAVPAAPNSNDQLYWIEVTPGMVRDLLPAGAAAGLARAYGPPVHVRIGAGVETARIRWSQEHAELIARIFGAGGDPPDRAELKDLVLNDEEQGALGISAASLPALARAAAAAVYAKYPARVHGARTGAMGNWPVVGQVGTVEHRVTEPGAALSVVSLTPETAAVDLWSYLDRGTRQVVMKLMNGPYRVGA